MAVYTAKGVDVRNFPPDSSIGGGEVVVRTQIIFAAAVTLATNDVLRMVNLPKGYVITDLEIDHDALGTGAVVSAGILNTGETAVASAGITGASVAASGIKFSNDPAARRVLPSELETKMVGLVVTTGASAALSAGAKVGLTMRYRPKQLVEPA